jgi:SAM-dependent methyltransferase
VSLDESYDRYPRIEESFQQRLDASLEPRGPDALFDVAASLRLPANGLALDVGCGEGRDTIALAQRFGLRVIGLDPVARHVEVSAEAAASEGLGSTVTFTLGTAERLQQPDNTVDVIWCKEVLMYADLAKAFSEFARVLRPGAVCLVYQVLTGPRMSDDEAREFWEGNPSDPAHSVRALDIETAAETAGMELRDRVDFGSEWGEFAQEQSGAGGRRLVHAARLLRDPQRYVEEFGESAYRIMLSDCLWHVYRMIGKLQGAAFVFNAPR